MDGAPYGPADANGNRTSAPGVLLTWNERDELSQVRWPFATRAQTWDYLYDPVGRRHEEVTNGTKTRAYVYDGLDPVRIATQYPGTEVLLSGPGLDAWVVKRDAFGTRQVFLGDGLGSTVKLAADDGTFPATFSYTPFGKTTVAGNAWERLRYTVASTSARVGAFGLLPTLPFRSRRCRSLTKSPSKRSSDRRAW